MSIEVRIVIEDCDSCPFKTEYHGSSGNMVNDYWLCDHTDRKIGDLTIIQEWCPLRN